MIKLVTGTTRMLVAALLIGSSASFAEEKSEPAKNPPATPPAAQPAAPSASQPATPAPASTNPLGEEATKRALAKADSLSARLADLQKQGTKRADDPKYFFELGNVYADLSRREDAAAAYQAALDLKGDYVEALVNYGSLQSERGETDQAIKLLAQAVELRPKDARAHVNLGAAYYSKSDYFKAVTEYRRALELDSKAHEAHYQLGVAYADAGIYREAVREWQLVVKLAPGTDAAKAASENLEVVKTILSRKS